MPVGRPPGLIDVHSHYLPDFYLAAARAAGHAEPDGFQWPSWSAANHLRMMDRLGIDTHTLGCVGVAIETNAHGMYLGDAMNEPLWASLAARGAVVLIHPTSPPCWEQVSQGRPRPMLEFIFDTTRAVTDLIFTGVLERHSSIRFVITHCGGALPLMGERIESFRRLAGDSGAPTGELLRRLWYNLAGNPIPHQLPALVRAVGTDQLLYGSDYCCTPEPGVAAQVAAIDADGGPGEDTSWRELTTRNAARLLSAGDLRGHDQHR